MRDTVAMFGSRTTTVRQAAILSGYRTWPEMKRAKDMPRQVIIARVGIHHRLLLRTDEGPLEVLDLVTRQSEDVALKRLRAVRGVRAIS